MNVLFSSFSFLRNGRLCYNHVCVCVCVEWGGWLYVSVHPSVPPQITFEPVDGKSGNLV
jgi:hypothetical protein